MKKQNDQQLVRVKTLLDSNDDDDDDTSSTSSISNGGESDRSSKITNLMRENERKIRNLSESYMNRFLLIGQQLQSVPSASNAVALPSASSSRTFGSQRSSGIESDASSTAPSFNLFVETLKQLIIREEKKREKCYLAPDDQQFMTDPYTRLSLGLTQCLRDYEAEMTHAKRRIQDLSEQQEHILSENKHVLSQLTEAFEQNTISLRQNYEKRLAKQREESLKIGHSLDNYKVEILTLREAYEKKLRVKDELITELNDRLAKNETEQAARQHALHLKIEHFQQSFETLQARNKQIEQNNQIKSKENHDLLQQISNCQIQIQRLQQTVTTKAQECTDLSQKLSSTIPKLAECERFGSELQQWFSLISPERSPSGLTLDEMSNIVAAKISFYEDFKKQVDLIREELDNGHLFSHQHLTDRIKNLIMQNKQMESSHHDISNKYQALLLQTNMLTGIIKQHSTEVAHHKSNEDQLKEFNEQLLNENQTIKMEMQDYRSKVLQLTNSTNQHEHELSLMKQRNRDLQIQCETSKAEQQMLNNELQTKRETIKRYEQELQSIRQLLEITLKEKQIQNDQLKHERQLFHSENDTLKQLVIRDGHDREVINQLPSNFNTQFRSAPKLSSNKDTFDDEIQRISSGVFSQPTDRYVPLINHENDETNDDVISRRATSTPTPRENDVVPTSNARPLVISRQIDQVLNDMKSLLSHGREVIDKHQETMIPERDSKLHERVKIRRVKKDRATVIGIEQH